MIKRPLLSTSIIALIASCLVAGSIVAEDKYDAKKYGPEHPIKWNKPVKAVFDHQIHTVDSDIECISCHDDIFFMQRGIAINSRKFTMKAMAEGEFCGACHDGDTAFATDTNCKSCHTVSEEPLMWLEPTKTAFSHTAHVEEYELECNSCHNGVFAMKKGSATANKDFTMASFKEGRYCGSCHNGDDAFDSSTQCESCHFIPTEKIFFNQPVKTVVFDHDIHVIKGELSCEACHKEVFTMKRGTVEGEQLLFSANPAEKRKYLETLHNKFCGTCHDSSQAFGYLTRCTVCHIGVKGYNKIDHGDAEKDSHGKSGH